MFLPNKIKIAFLLGGFLSLLPNEARPNYTVVIPEYSSKFTHVANSIIRSVPNREGIVVNYSELSASSNKHDLLITIGKEVTRLVNKNPKFNKVPHISGFIPRSLFKAKKHKAAVFNDINLSLQIALIRRLFPKKEPRIGFFYDNETSFLIEDAESIKIEGFFLVFRHIKEEENPTSVIDGFVKRNQLDAFIIVPSSKTYDPHMMFTMLFMLYQLNVAAITYTPGLVEGGKGSVAATYFDISKVISEISSQIEIFYKNGTVVEKGITPTTANIVVNKKLAKALGIDVSNIKEYGDTIYEK